MFHVKNLRSAQKKIQNFSTNKFSKIKNFKKNSDQKSEFRSIVDSSLVLLVVRLREFGTTEFCAILFVFFFVSVVIFGKFHFIHIKWNNNNNSHDEDDAEKIDQIQAMSWRCECVRCTCWMNMFNVYNMIQKQNAQWKVLRSEIIVWSVHEPMNVWVKEIETEFVPIFFRCLIFHSKLTIVFPECSYNIISEFFFWFSQFSMF